MDLFRHEPNLTRQFLEWERNPKETHSVMDVNKVMKPKSSQLIVYIHSTVGYNELILLRRAFKDRDVKVVCRNASTVKEWISSQL